MKVLVVNQHANNFGDEAAGAALVQNLLQLSEIECIELLYCMPGYIPINDNRVIHNHDLNVRTFRRIEFLKYIFTGKAEGAFLPCFLKKLKEYDCVVVSPCGANLGIYKDWQLLFQDLTVVKNRKRLIFHLNTISPSGNYLFDKLVIKLCRKSEVYVREKASYDYLMKNHVNVRLGTDSAFSLKSQNKIIATEKRIVFVPSDVWSWHVDFKGKSRQDYEENVIKPLADFAYKYNMEVTILPHTNTNQEMKFNKMTKELLKKQNQNVSVNIVSVTSVYDYENIIRSAYIVIGMRYHTIVFAVKNAIPFLAISYEQKIVEVSCYSRMDRYCMKLKSAMDLQMFSEKLNEVYLNHDKIRNELSEISKKIMDKSLIVIHEQFN